MKKTSILFGAIILVFALLVGCNSNNSQSDKNTEESSYEGIIDLVIKAYTGLGLSESEVRKIQPEDYFSYIEKEGEGFSNYYEIVLQENKTSANAMIARFGKDYKVYYEITENRKMSIDEEYQATEFLISAPWYDARKVKEVQELVVELLVRGEKGSQTFELIFQVMHYENGWYMLSVKCDDFPAFKN